ncbi:synaptonemal complex central element protein 3 isoform X3 [Rissa tridactyla]|uniref:synaptonemal complex central element protein 3 isoform X3 n=1 Tax=Rissa tridactyla TaxID=75485 RepID=UPI0023BAC3B9|nr:synaptonemal complex central element protein 3 isoform X3 [Rissa tridactyla]
MAESEPQEGNYDNMVKMVEDLNRDLENLLEEMEKLTDLATSMRRLEDAFLSCKEEVEKKWQDVLSESKAVEASQTLWKMDLLSSY